MCCLIFVKLTQAGTNKKRDPQLSKHLQGLACLQVCRGGGVIFLDPDYRGGVQPRVGGATLGRQLGVSKKTGIESKPLSSAPPWRLLWFLPPGSCFEFLPISLSDGL